MDENATSSIPDTSLSQVEPPDTSGIQVPMRPPEAAPKTPDLLKAPVEFDPSRAVLAPDQNVPPALLARPTEPKVNTTPPTLLARPKEPEFDPTKAVPAEEAQQVVARNNINEFLAGQRKMSPEEFKINNDLAEGGTYATTRAIKGVWGIGTGLAKKAHDLMFSPEERAHAADWIGTRAKELVEPYIDAGHELAKGNILEASKAWATGEAKNLKNVGVGITGGTAGIVSTATGLAQGAHNLQDELSGLSLIKRIAGIDDTTEKYLSASLQNKINSATDELYKTTDTSPDNVFTEIGALIPWIAASEVTGVGGLTGMAGRLGEMAPGVAQKAAAIGAKGAEFGVREGVPLATGVGVGAAFGHPAIGGLVEFLAQKILPNNWMRWPSRMVHALGDWPADKIKGLADMLSTAGRPGQAWMEALSERFAGEAEKSAKVAADLRAGAEASDVVKYLNPDNSWKIDPNTLGPKARESFLKSVPKDINTIVDVADEARALQAKAALSNKFLTANKIMSSAMRGATTTAASIGEAGLLGGAMAGAESAPGDIERIQEGANSLAMLAAPFAPLSAASSLRGARMADAAKHLMSTGKGNLFGDASSLPQEWRDYAQRVAGMAKPFGAKVVLHTEEAARVEQGLSGGQSPGNGWVDTDGNIHLVTEKIGSGVAGHEFTHATQGFFGEMLRKLAPDKMQEFEAKYGEALARTGNTRFDSQAERDAEVGRFVLQNTPMEMFFGGERGGDILKRWVGNLLGEGNTMTIPGFNAPVTREDIINMKQRFFKAGELAARAEAGPAGPPPVPRAEILQQKVQDYVNSGMSEDAAIQKVAAELSPQESFVSPETGETYQRPGGRQDPPVGGITQQFMPDFYSRASQTLQANPQGKWDADQLRGFLKGKGISQNEMEWSGINDLQGKLTKEQALQAIQLPKVIETKLGGATSMNETAQDLYGVSYDSLDASAQKHVQNTFMGNSDTHYGPLTHPDLNLPGGTNYRELLFQLEHPEPKSGLNPEEYKRFTDLLKERYGDALTAEGRPTRYVADEEGELKALRAKHSAGLRHPEDFTTSHFNAEYPNTVAHARVDDRVDPVTGGKMLFMQEGQWDWGHGIWERGTKPKDFHEQFEDVRKQIKEIMDLPDPSAEDLSRLADLTKQKNDLIDVKHAPPDMPFKGDAGKKYLFRQIIKHAVNEGYDSIGWTTGEQQAARYDLSHHIQQLHWNKSRSGDSIGIRITNPEGERDLGYFSKEGLDGVVGKELASKIRASEDTQGDFHGLDLKVGGEGKKAMYDVMFPKLFNELGKKFGARTGDVKIRTRDAGDTAVSGGQGGHPYTIVKEAGSDTVYVEEKATGHQTGPFTQDAAEKWISDQLAGEGENIHRIPITPEMRASVQEHGQPMFMPEVNIGMHVGGEEKLTMKDMADALQAVPGVKILKASEQRKEGMEPTGVFTLSRALTAKEGDAVSRALDQESIAQHQVGGQGDLFGPQAEKWGPFNTDYFVGHDGRQLTDTLKDYYAKHPKRTGASGIWDRMTVDPNFMQGEFEKAAEATGANPKERFYRQTPAAQQKITDYFMSQQLAQYMPDTGPAIKSAAVKDADGRIFVGTYHGDAIDKAQIAKARGFKTNDESWDVPYKVGFVDDKGKFLTREQALTRGKAIGQLPKDFEGYPGDPEGIVHVGDFRRAAAEGGVQFMPSPHPDAIADIAIKTPNGKVYASRDYMDVIGIRPEDAGPHQVLTHPELHDFLDAYLIKGLHKADWGFVTNSGEYLNREQAFKRATELKQIDESAFKKARAKDQDMRPEDIKTLESMRFSDTAQFMPDIPSDTQLKDALSEDKAPKVGAHRDLPKGTPVSLRIDIPAYNKTGDYAVTVHDRNIGKVHGYDGIATVDNPTFYVQEKGAQKVKEGMAKYPMAAVNGDFNPSRTIPKDINDYTKVGFNPVRHSYFYDKSTGDPVISGDKAISAGNTVYVKNPVYGNPAGFLYMPDMPTAIDRAALRNKETGEIITGGQNDTHFMIPATSGKADDYLGPNGHKIYEEGFVSQAGHWYDREQAHTQMKALGQLPPNYQGEYKDELNVTDLRKGRQAQMMPSPHPDAIKESALRTPDGKIWTGTLHSDASDKMVRYYYKMGRAGELNKWLEGHNYESGFITNNGKFLDRQESLNRALKHKQIEEEHARDMLVEQEDLNVPEQDMGLEAYNFRSAKEAQESHPSELEEFKYMPNTPEDAIAQTAAESKKYPEAKPLRWKLDETGKPAMIYDKKTKKTTAKPLEEGYNLAKQYLAEQAAEGKSKTEAHAAKIKVAKDKLKEFYDVAKTNPEAMQANGWYRELKEKLLDKLGGNDEDLILFTRLLATTSPNTNPGVNFGFALDAWNRFQKGEYKDVIDRYNQALTDFYAGKLKHTNGKPVEGLKQFAGYLYGNDIIPYATGYHEKGPQKGDPKKLGMHSLRVLDTISDHYDRINGLKINQFAHNLAQTDLKSTIDLWAARTLHRLLNDGNTNPWRILPMNEKGISEADFHFAQEAFGKAAEELKVSPDDLQAILWFAEKIHYDKQGWSTYLDKGDFRPLVERMVPDVAPKTFRLADVQPPQ